MLKRIVGPTAAIAFLVQRCGSLPSTPQPPYEHRPEITLATGDVVSAEALSAALDGLKDQTGVNGYSAAVINDGVIVYHHVSGTADVAAGLPVTKETTFEAASLPKPLFGAFVVHLADEGVLDLDRPLADYWPHPDLTGDKRAELFTARMVLTHRTGLPNWRSDTADKILRIGFEPGTQYRYSGEGYEYLADVIMLLVETDDVGLDTRFRAWLLDPRGIDATSLVQSAETLDRKSKGYGNGEKFSNDVNYRVAEFDAAHSVHSEALCYAKAMIALMDGSALSEEATDVFYERQGTAIPADDPGRAVGLVDWGLGFAIYDTLAGTFYGHGGNNRGYTSFVAITPEAKWGVALSKGLVPRQ